MKIIDLLTEHAPVWDKLLPMLKKDRLAQALLFVAPRGSSVTHFCTRLMALLLCDSQDTPCGECRSCRWVLKQTHPDIHYIKQDAPDKAIKIDQIRDLQETIYQTPQYAVRRIILIERADALNASAANALLKILEEPPAHSIFILMAEHLTTIPATITSRCQISLIPSVVSSENDANNHCEAFIVEGLTKLMEAVSSPCSIVETWASYPFSVLVEHLYRLIAYLIQVRLLGFSDLQGNLQSTKIERLAKRLNPVDLYKLLDQLHGMQQKINENIMLNSTLTLESFLINTHRMMQASRITG